jgi:hypothetical protein
MTHPRLIAAALLLALGAVCGCGAGPKPAPAGEPKAEALREVGDLLRAGNRPPSKAADLAKYEPTYPRGYQALKSGEVVAIWGAAMKGEGDAAGGGGEVIAYEKDAPIAGGYVLLTSGEVKQMSAAEFQAAPKAAKR